MSKKIITSAKKNRLWQSAAISICTASALSFLCFGLLGLVNLANIVMIFLLSTFFIAISLGRNAAIFSSVINVAFFDFFFVTPRFSFSVDDSQYLITFLVMLLVGLITGHMAARLKERINDISTRERLAKALHSLSQGLFSAKSTEVITQVAKLALEVPFDIEINLIIDNKTGYLATTDDQHLVSRAMQSGTRIFNDQDNFRGESKIFIPIRSELSTFGVLIATDSHQSLKVFGRDDLLLTAANLIAMALMQMLSIKAQEQSKVEAATERLKNTILSSLSHDLRTPLTTMIGLADNLKSSSQNLDETSKEAIETIRTQGLRLSSLIGNMLEMARLQTQKPTLKKEWQPIEEVIGTSIKQFRDCFPRTTVRVKVNPEVPILLFDSVLIERVLFNLLENAAKFSDQQSQIQIVVERVGDVARISVIDDGPGFSKDPDTLFKMFARGQSDTSRSGMGLGLAICREIVQAHDGRIAASRNHDQPGSTITFELPIMANPGLPST